MRDQLTAEQRAVEILTTHLGFGKAALELTDAIATTIREAERAQMELDCVASCAWCERPETWGPAKIIDQDGDYYHLPLYHGKGETEQWCDGNAIRHAWAARLPLEGTPDPVT